MFYKIVYCHFEAHVIDRASVSAYLVIVPCPLFPYMLDMGKTNGLFPTDMEEKNLKQLWNVPHEFMTSSLYILHAVSYVQSVQCAACNVQCAMCKVIFGFMHEVMTNENSSSYCVGKYFVRRKTHERKQFTIFMKKKKKESKIVYIPAMESF